jgi:hypothetical protein
MKLNSEIIFDGLQQFLNVDMVRATSPTDGGLLLGRPRIFLGSEKTFSANQLYIALAERLPHRPVIDEGVTIICVGDSMQLTYYQDHCHLLVIREQTDILRVVNLVHSIFDRYDAWNQRLYDILNNTASIREMLESSTEIFGNPLFVIDSDFRMIADASHAGVKAAQVDLAAIAEFLQLHELSMDAHEPLVLNLLDTSTLNINLFRKEEYIGCLTIDYHNRPHRPSDIPLAKHLSGIVIKAMQKYSVATGSERKVLHQALRDAVSGLPPTPEQRLAIERGPMDREYLCIKIIVGSLYGKLPLGYIANEVEDTFARSSVIVLNDSVVGFIQLDKTTQSVIERLVELIDSLDISIGVSDIFCNLSEASHYYKQASAALEIGLSIDPQLNLYAFQDYALLKLIVDSVGDLPLEMYFTAGLRRLIEHDAKTHISYVETLRAYLNNNMSVSRTASELFLHRSTLLERVERIKRLLGNDLADADERLRIQLLLKAMQSLVQIRSRITRQEP